MSIYFMLMRGDYDANLRWPFKYKVTFTLIDQSATNDDKRDIIKYCWPNTKETCFGYPIADMNIPYGISKCFGHDLFEQNEKRYVQNDRMFIKIEVDHLSEISGTAFISKND
jgi:TNF receptor-associated factor 2